MDEIIDIITELGEPTGTTALKSEAHKNGWYHNTVHLWLYTKSGEILLQQRSHLKQIHPMLWDVSVAGHIDAGESFKEAALREAKEEIGIDLKESQLIHIGAELHKGEYNNGAIKDYEFHQMFVAEFNTPLASLLINTEEVEAIKLVSIPEFKTLLNNSRTNSHFIPTNIPYYQFIIGQIQKRLL
ncbi:NUDIX hydrolase [Winogradskyella aurantiaca]|uniref:NUDIX hydrolase n=1 Tax=Winogradskyella aurantiaca TaxID=2219558 RepID=UPI000E1CB462|nr:NUDIX domain-containing protein [Winogradskyella aurantiaca]